MALHLVSVTRRFGSHLALDAVSLHVRRGDCYGFLGHNGAGKTTSMRIALGLERADGGRVIVDGFDAAEHPRESRARMGGLIETPGFHGHLSGAANLVLLARVQGFSRDAAKTEASRLLGAVGLDSAGTKHVAAYSQGMRQRLGIAQALLGSPQIVLLDEPMSGLDPEGIDEVRRLLHRLTREEGMTVLLSSHQLGEIAGLCNRIGILRQGRMLLEEETSKLLAAEAGRYALATADDAAAARILEAAGVATSPSPAGGLDVTLGARAPGEVARSLVSMGVELRTWAPRPPSLDEIYLRFAKGDAAAARAAGDHAVATSEPAARRAPPHPKLRAMAYELRRWTSSAAVPLLLALPVLVAVGSVWGRHGDLERDASEVAGGTLATASKVTAFEAFGGAIQSALPLVLLAVAGIASQSIAGENARGTLRNLLLRPLRRSDAVVGKGAALAIAALVSFALVAGAAFAAASQWFEWRDVAEILPNGELFPIPGGEAAVMRPAVLTMLAGVLPLLAAFAAIGLFAGAVARSGAGGLALALGFVLLLQVLRVPASMFGVEGWLPTAHVPWARALGDDSVVRVYLDATQAIANVRDPFKGLHTIVPLAWTALAFGAAALVLRRRSIR
jgi:ABC-type multidrug transport system ATPase subunit